MKVTVQLSRFIMSGVLCVAGLCFCSSADAQSKTKGLELLDKLPAPTELRTFKVVPLTAAESQQRSELSKRLADQSGLRLQKSDAKFSDGRIGQIGAQDPSASFEYDAKLGRLLFNGGLSKYRAESSTLGLPKPEQAAALAQRQVEALKLPLNTREFAGVRVGGVNMGVPDGLGGTKVFEKLRTVRFSRTLAGFAVEGDTRVVVHLGSNGALAGLVYQWPTVAAGETLRSEQLVKTDAIRKLAIKQLDEITASADEAFLTGADLVLYDDGRGVLEHAYHFTVERYYGYGKGEATMIPFDFYVPAVVASRAFYPHLEVAAVKAGDGRDERPQTNDNGKDD